MSPEAVTFGWVISPTTPSARAAEAGGAGALTAQLLDQNRAFIAALPAPFTTLWVEDHLQWGDQPTLDACTTLAYLAALYPRYRIGSIVLSQSYRNPALTAKMAATLQVLSGGRFILGLGAGWKHDEYAAYGYAYPSAAERIAQLGEAVQIVKALFAHSPATFSGHYYRIEDAYCEPRPTPPIPLLIGGSGEQKTLRVVAKHADLWNGAFSTPADYAHKQAVLAAHCQAIGRDPRTITHTYFGFIDLSAAQDAAARLPMYIHHGTSQQVVAELQAFIDLGVRHLMLRFTDFPATAGLQRFAREVLPALDLA